MDRAKRVGNWISGSVHAGVLAWVVIGGLPFGPLSSDAQSTTEVTTMSEAQFQEYAAAARGAGPVAPGGDTAPARPGGASGDGDSLAQQIVPGSAPQQAPRPRPAERAAATEAAPDLSDLNEARRPASVATAPPAPFAPPATDEAASGIAAATDTRPPAPPSRPEPANQPQGEAAIGVVTAQTAAEEAARTELRQQLEQAEAARQAEAERQAAAQAAETAAREEAARQQAAAAAAAEAAEAARQAEAQRQAAAQAQAAEAAAREAEAQRLAAAQQAAAQQAEEQARAEQARREAEAEARRQAEAEAQAEAEEAAQRVEARRIAAAEALARREAEARQQAEAQAAAQQALEQAAERARAEQVRREAEAEAEARRMAEEAAPPPFGSTLDPDFPPLESPDDALARALAEAQRRDETDPDRPLNEDGSIVRRIGEDDVLADALEEAITSDPQAFPPDQIGPNLPSSGAAEGSGMGGETGIEDGDPLARALTEALTIIPAGEGGGNPGGEGDGPGLSAAEIAAFRDQVAPCWNLDMLSLEARNLTISLRLSLSPDAQPEYDSIRLEEATGANGLPVPQAAAAQAFNLARRAVMQCAGATGYPLPRDRYSRWHEIVINFHPEGYSSGLPGQLR